ncbi:MAG: transposase [Anaerolineae bacterium]|nr:transposase [Anaerolineae bacterium]
MAHYYQGKYRQESSRLPGWDYGGAGYYFITICTEDEICCLGKIIEGTAYVSPLGMIVAEEWWRTPQIRPYVQLDAYQVMPNHFHGILVITQSQADSEGAPAKSRLAADSVSSIFGQFKSVCTKRIWALGAADFRWQERFHDHIIRSEEELERIRAYIQGNPGKWHEDRYYRADM